MSKTRVGENGNKKSPGGAGTPAEGMTLPQRGE